MKKLMIVIAAVAALSGCATKTRSVELSGMYVSEAGTLAIGNVDVMASPTGEESAFIKYSEDTAWLSPTTKTHDIKVMLTGTNSVDKVEVIVTEICKAFSSTAADIAKVNKTEGGTTALDVVKAAAEKAATTSVKVDAPTADAACADGSCTDTDAECADGSCTDKD